MTSSLSRRHALTGVATVGLGAPLLAACSDSSDSPGGQAKDPTTPSASSTPPATSAPADPTTTVTAEGGTSGLVASADVPVGGGVVLAEEKLVVTQPTAGTFEAFTALCTHQGCLVGSVADGAIVCPCHQSMFSITDGSVLSGPASSPLAGVGVEVVGGQVVRS